MSMIPPYLAPPMDPLLGGSLGIGRTGLAGIGGLPPLPGAPTGLPYANPLTYLPRAGGLAAQVPLGAGQEAASWALGAMPGGPSATGGRLASMLPSVARPGTTGLMRFVAPGVSGRAALGRAGLGAVAGNLASGLIDRTDIGGQNSNLEQGLQGAAQGAGLGAGIGSIVPGVGTATGAVVGGLAGGAVGVLANIFGGGGGDDAPKPTEVLATAMTQGGLTPQQQEMVLQTYETQVALAESLSGDEKDAAIQAALDGAGNLVLGFMSQNQQQSQVQSDLTGPSMLALQQQASDIFEPLAQDIEANASLYAQAVAGLRDSLPEQYRSIADLEVAREQSSSSRLADAYRAQAALSPMVQRLTQYQQDQASLANQLWQQQMAQQMATTGGGGGTDVLSRLTPTG